MAMAINHDFWCEPSYRQNIGDRENYREIIAIGSHRMAITFIAIIMAIYRQKHGDKKIKHVSFFIAQVMAIIFLTHQQSRYFYRHNYGDKSMAMEWRSFLSPGLN